jgi:pimeloyl-ACP methyl ester carboxylesterase
MPAQVGEKALVALLLELAFLAVACTRYVAPERASEPHDATAPSVAVPEPDAGAPPLAGFPELLELRDGNEKLGFVSVPLGAREPRPIMIALHGGSDKPELACAAWRRASEAYAFIVCPRGFGGNEARLGWRTSSDTAQRVARAVVATRQIFGERIRSTPSVVLAGFSMGGSQVALLARDDPKTYRRIVVGDSAHDPQPALTFSRDWHKGGGERAVFLCSTSGCEPSFRKAARNAAHEKALARLNIAATQVHGLSEDVVRSMQRDWPWLVEGAEGWETYLAPGDPSLPGRTESFDPE